jgi:hypothetical protein
MERFSFVWTALFANKELAQCIVNGVTLLGVAHLDRTVLFNLAFLWPVTGAFVLQKGKN